MFNKTKLILFFCLVISIFLHFYKINKVPPCINADEAAFAYNTYSLLKTEKISVFVFPSLKKRICIAAFAYNTYSLLKTGKDEYGNFLPLRFESFKDYKLQAYTYLSIPFIAIFGLNDFSARALNIVIGVAFVPLMYFLLKELFNNRRFSLIGSFLTSLSPGMYILSRHAHEGVVGTFFVLCALLFLVKYLKTNRLIHFIVSNIFILLNAFSYQTGRIYMIVFFFMYIFILFKEGSGKKNLHNSVKKLVIVFTVVFISLFSDFKYGLNRVNNLFFFKNSGFNLRLTEYLAEQDR